MTRRLNVNWHLYPLFHSFVFPQSKLMGPDLCVPVWCSLMILQRCVQTENTLSHFIPFLPAYQVVLQTKDGMYLQNVLLSAFLQKSQNNLHDCQNHTKSVRQSTVRIIQNQFILEYNGNSLEKEVSSLNTLFYVSEIEYKMCRISVIVLNK